MRLLPRQISLSIVLLLSGCAMSNQMYPGPKRPENEVSIMYATKDLAFMTLDGQKVTEGWLRTIVHTLPGAHLIELVLSKSSQVPSGTKLEMGYGVVKWDAVAGHYYSCTLLISDTAKTWKPIIQDVTELRRSGQLEGIVVDSGYKN